jgi:hypothetical protein
VLIQPIFAALVLLLSLLTSITAIPDVILPGHKGVTHELILLWDETDATYRFVAHPVRGLHGHSEIERGVPFTFSSKYGTKIYAVPATAEFPPDREDVLAVEWPGADVPIAEIRSVSKGSPLAHIESTVQVEAVTAKSIEFRFLSERRLDSAGVEVGDFDYLLLVLIAGAGVVLLLVLNRRSKRMPANE